MWARNMICLYCIKERFSFFVQQFQQCTSKRQGQLTSKRHSTVSQLSDLFFLTKRDHGFLREVCCCHFDHFICISASSSCFPRWRVSHAGLSRVQARREQILFQARSAHLPVHWVLFLPGLSYSNEVQEDHACS